MIVVADTGPLHYLILLEHAELLHGLYGEVVVRDAVATELSSPSTPTAVRDWHMLQRGSVSFPSKPTAFRRSRTNWISANALLLRSPGPFAPTCC